MKKILILMHEYQIYNNVLLIDTLSKIWQKKNLSVSFIYGIKNRPDADLLIPSIDLTVTPQEYIDFINSYPNVVNRNVWDISKRKISTNIINENDNYSGPVIVKTNNNYSGIPEILLQKFQHPILSKFIRKVPFQYKIYNNLFDVPKRIFKNSELIVEKFLPEKQNDQYFIRHYIFLGNKERTVRTSSVDPFIKNNLNNREHGLPLPLEVSNLRKSLNLDYGKIDYTINENKTIILDVNKTIGGFKDHKTALEISEYYADGIWSLLN